MPADLDQLTAQHQAAVAQVRAVVDDYARRYWGMMASYHDADIEKMVRAIVPHVQAGQITVARLTDAYLAPAAKIAGWGMGGDAAMIDPPKLRGGVPPEEVYRRPGEQVWTELSKGSSVAVAAARGQKRLMQLIDGDIQLAMRAQAARSMPPGTRYRRVVTGAETCALCMLASTQVYQAGHLMPIHPGCDCTVQPIRRYTREMRRSDADILQRTHEAVSEAGYDAAASGGHGGGGDDYRGITIRDKGGKLVADGGETITVYEHGEYGPTLAWAGQHHRGPAEAARLSD